MRRSGWVIDETPAAHVRLINGDRRPDIAATADAGSSRVAGARELRWWRNEGRASRR